MYFSLEVKEQALLIQIYLAQIMEPPSRALAQEVMSLSRISGKTPCILCYQMGSPIKSRLSQVVFKMVNLPTIIFYTDGVSSILKRIQSDDTIFDKLYLSHRI